MRPVLKGVGLGALLITAAVVMSYGAFFIIFGIDWGKLGGILLLAVGFRAVIAVFDSMWERPPQFSRFPWRRPWVDEPFGEEPDIDELMRRAAAQRRHG
jgi:hypothetical protein